MLLLHIHTHFQNPGMQALFGYWVCC